MIVREVVEAVRSRRISACDLVARSRDAIDHDAHLRALLAVDGERGLAAADVIDATIKKGNDPGPPAGVPVGVKDLTETAGRTTTDRSRAFRANVPSEDAVLVARLRTAGAIVVGKTNTPAFGMLGETKNRLGADARYDAMVCPATAVPAFPLREPPVTIGGRAAAPGWISFMPFPTAFNLGGQPTVTVPVGVTEVRLPVGLMIASPPGRRTSASILHVYWKDRRD